VALEFLQEPPANLRDLWSACQRAFWSTRSGAEAYPISNVTISAVETPIRHGLKVIPKTAIFVSRTGDVGWWLSTPPDASFIYVTGFGDATGDLVVFP
jgi:hypothetical protein